MSRTIRPHKISERQVGELLYPSDFAMRGRPGEQPDTALAESARFKSRADALRSLERGEIARFVAGTLTLRAAIRGGAYAFGRSQEGLGRRFRCRRAALEHGGAILDVVEVERVA